MIDVNTLFAPCLARDAVLLAVSGGSDSMALLHLFAVWHAGLADTDRPRVAVATVDHQLRRGSADEARAVASACDRLGFAHATLVWSGRKPQSGLPAAARDARYQLLADHVEALDCTARWAVLTGHTLDDQAETVVMRWSRGAGLEGVAGMRASRPIRALDSTVLMRPLLDVERTKLRRWLSDHGVGWTDDPTNTEIEFERPRWRQALDDFEALGLARSEIARTAARLGDEQAALEALVDRELRAPGVRHLPGLWASVPLVLLKGVPNGLRTRVLRRVLAAIGGATHLPDRPPVEGLAVRIGSGDVEFQQTVGGCLVYADGSDIWFAREPPRRSSANLSVQLAAPGIYRWDKRLRLQLGVSLESAAVRIVRDADLPADLRQPITDLPEAPKPISAAAFATAPAIIIEAEDATALIWRGLSDPAYSAKIAAHRGMALQLLLCWRAFTNDRPITPEQPA